MKMVHDLLEYLIPAVCWGSDTLRYPRVFESQSI